MSFMNSIPLLKDAITDAYGTPVAAGTIRGQGLTITAIATTWGTAQVVLWGCYTNTLDTTKYITVCDYAGNTVVFGGNGSCTIPIVDPGMFFIAQLVTVGGGTTPVNVYMG